MYNFKSTFVNKILKSFLQMLTGQSVLTIVSIVSGYSYALFLGPALYGIWQTAAVFIGYGSFLSLGLPFIMRRDFIILRSEGNFEQANNLAHLTFSFSSLVQIVFAFLVVIYSMTLESSELRFSILVVGLILIVTIPSGFGNIIHKGINDYNTISKAEFVYGITILLLLPFVYFKGYYWLLISILSANIFKSFFYYFNRPFNYKFYWDCVLLRKMIYLAFPLFLYTIISTIFITIDRIIIASFLSYEKVGYYSLGSLISSPVNLLIGSLSIVLFTQLNEKFGTSTSNHVLLMHVEIPIKFISILLSPIVGMGIIALPYLTNLLLPKYVEGVYAAQITVVSSYFLALSGFTGNGLFLINKQKISAIAFLFSGVIKTIGSIFLIKIGYGIEGVAVITLVSFLIYHFILLIYFYKYLKEDFKNYFMKIVFDFNYVVIVLLYCFIFISYGDNFLINYTLLSPLSRILIGELSLLIISIMYIYMNYTKYKNVFLK